MFSQSLNWVLPLKCPSSVVSLPSPLSEILSNIPRTPQHPSTPETAQPPAISVYKLWTDQSSWEYHISMYIRSIKMFLYCSVLLDRLLSIAFLFVSAVSPLLLLFQTSFSTFYCFMWLKTSTSVKNKILQVWTQFTFTSSVLSLILLFRGVIMFIIPSCPPF